VISDVRGEEGDDFRDLLVGSETLERDVRARGVPAALGIPSLSNSYLEGEVLALDVDVDLLVERFRRHAGHRCGDGRSRH
jgi:hypothetical protein